MDKHKATTTIAGISVLALIAWLIVWLIRKES